MSVNAASRLPGSDIDVSQRLEVGLLDRLTAFFNRFMDDCSWQADYSDSGQTIITVTDPDAMVGVEIDDVTVPGQWTAYRLGTESIIATDPALSACLLSLLSYLCAPAI